MEFTGSHVKDDIHTMFVPSSDIKPGNFKKNRKYHRSYFEKIKLIDWENQLQINLLIDKPFNQKKKTYIGVQ